MNVIEKLKSQFKYLRGLLKLAPKFRLWMILLLMILPAFLCLLFIKNYGVNVVYWDQWEIVPLFDKLYSGHLSFADLFAQQNEHRILVPRIVMLLLGIITHYNTVAEMYFSWCLICLISFVLFIAYTKIFGNTPNSLIKFVPVVWILFSLRQWENLLWGFQVAFFMEILFLVLSLFLLETSKKPNWKFAFSVICGLFCTFTLANGMLIWPIGLAQILLVYRLQQKEQLRPYLKMATAWSLIGIISCILYFVTYTKPSSSPSFLYFIQQPISSIRFLLASIGSPLAIEIFSSVSIGILIIFIFFWIIYLLIKKIGKKENLSPFFLSMLIFASLSILILFLGRSGWGVEHALVSRYTTLTALGLIGLFLLILSLQFSNENLRKFLLTGLSVIIVMGLITTNTRAIKEGESTEYTRNMAAYFLSNYEVQSDQNLAMLFPYASVVRERVNVLKKYKLNVFYQPFLNPTQPTISESNTYFNIYTVNDHLFAENTSIIIDPLKDNTLTIIGWAVDKNAHEAASGVVISIDGQKDIPALYGLDRWDVAEFLNDSKYRYSGYIASFSSSILDKGQHLLSIKIITANKQQYYLATQQIVVDVK
jgi:hypothetical protein